MSFSKYIISKNWNMILKNLIIKIKNNLITLFKILIFFPYLIYFIYKNKNRNINIISINSSFFGHFVVESLCYLILNNTSKNNYFFTEDNISNYFLFNFLKIKLEINQKLKFLKFFCQLLKIKNIHFYTLKNFLEKKKSFNLDFSYAKIFYNQSKLKINFKNQDLKKQMNI